MVQEVVLQQQKKKTTLKKKGKENDAIFELCKLTTATTLHSQLNFILCRRQRCHI